MKLYESLPDSVYVGRKKVKLDLEFRNVLRMLETLQRADLLPDAREWLAVRCICRKPVKGLLEAVKKLLFDQQPGKQSKKITSFEQDADLIRSAFWQVYGINLWTEKLHWMEFTCLLHGIPEDTRYAEVLGIRAREMPEPTKYNLKEREALARAKSAVALKLTDEETDDIYQRDVQNIFDVLFSRTKEVKPCQTEESSSKLPPTDEKHTPA